MLFTLLIESGAVYSAIWVSHPRRTDNYKSIDRFKLAGYSRGFPDRRIRLFERNHFNLYHRITLPKGIRDRCECGSRTRHRMFSPSELKQPLTSSFLAVILYPYRRQFTQQSL